MATLSSNPSSVVSAGVWLTTGNVYTSDNTYATDSGATQNTEYAFEVGGFNLTAIPDGSTINSVTVTIEAKSGTNNRAQIKGELFDGSTALTPILALTNVTNADANYTFQPVATLAQLESPNLKVRVTNKRIVSQANVTSVDYVKIDVVYTPATANGSLSLSGTASAQARISSASGSLALSATANAAAAGYPKISTLTDTFDTFNTGTWYSFGSPGASVGGGRLAANYAGATWGGARAPTVDWYDLTDSSVFGRVWPHDTGAVGRETNFRVQNNGASSWIGFNWTNTGRYIILLLREDSVNDNVVIDPYDPVAHAWVRIRLVGTTAYWDTSPNGVVWTNQRTRTITPSKYNQVELELSAGQGTDLGTYPPAYFDNINVPQTLPKVETLTDTFDTQIDPVVWSNSFGSYSWEAGRVKLLSTEVYSGIATGRGFSFTDSSVFARVVPAAAVEYSRETSFSVDDDGGHSLTWIFYADEGGWQDRKLICRVWDNGNKDDTYLSYDACNMAWFRIRSVGTTAYWETSPDAVTWTVRRTVVAPLFNFNIAAVSFNCGQWQTGHPMDGLAFIDNVNVAAPTPLMETFTDDFATSVDPLKWNSVSTNWKAANIVWEAGRAKITTVGTDYQNMVSLQAYDLRNSSVIAKPTPPAAPRPSTELEMKVGSYVDNTHHASVIWTEDGGGWWHVWFRNREDNTNYESARLNYDATAMAWWRIRLLAGTFYFDSSPDGSTWTNRWYRTPGAASVATFSSTQLIFDAGQWNAADSGTPAIGYVDNVNVLPPSGSTATGSLSLSASATARSPITATGSLDLSATATARSPAAASPALSLAASATARAAITPTGSLSLSATALTQGPGATGALTLGGTATARAAAPVSTGSLSLAASASAQSTGVPTGSLSLSATVTASAPVQPTGSISLAGSASAVPSGLTASGSITFSGTAIALQPGTASGVLSLTGSVGTVRGALTASAAVALAGTATGVARAPASTGSLALSGTLTARATPSGSGVLVLAGSSTARARLVASGSVALTGVAAIAAGRPKVWTGSAQVSKPGKYWNGSAWVEKPWKHWTGSGWKASS